MHKLVYTFLLFLMPYTAMNQQSISGDISLPNGVALCDVLVELRDASNEVIDQDLSDVNGFSNLTAT